MKSKVLELQYVGIARLCFVQATCAFILMQLNWPLDGPIQSLGQAVSFIFLLQHILLTLVTTK